MEDDQECIYDEVRQLVAVSPEKTQYDSKERVLFVFNKPLLVDGGPYEVEFKGDSHCLRVPAVLLNSCTIQTHAPVYYPPGKTTVTIYDKIKQHDPFIAQCSFEFVSRSQILGDVLEKATDPQQLLCDSCGISTADMKQFDEAMAKQIQQKAPNDFHLLDSTQEFPGKAEEQTNSGSKYATLIHFGAAHGLMQTVAACLRYCPAALKACALKNIDGMCPKEMAVEHGYLELSEDLQDFEFHEKSNPNKVQSKNLPDNTTNNNAENEVEYEEMSPTDLAFEEPGDDEYDYVKMAPNPGCSKNEIRMTPELWKAIFIAEQAVNESWRNNRLGEETVKAFSQFIQKSARQNSDSLSPTYAVPPGQFLAPALPPKFYPDKKRHSIHDIPNSAPPLPPRSPLSPRSSMLLNGVGGLVLGDRHGSDPNIFHSRMQQNFDKYGTSDEAASKRPGSPDQPPELPARTKNLLPARALGSLVNERRGSAPNLSSGRSHCDKPHGSFNKILRKSLTLPPKPGQVANGLQPHPDLLNGFHRQKSNSLDATSMGLSPRLPPRQPRPSPRRQRTVSCEPALPTYSGVKSRALSEPDEDGYMTVITK